jgi:hypothetical protein
MEEWSSFLFEVASWTLAVLAAFEGARRIASGRRTRAAFLLVTAGVLWCGARGALALYVASSLASIDIEPIRPRELTQDWGSQLAPIEREKASRAYARVAFNSTGRLFEYFNQSGERKRFTPNQEEVREREAAVQLRERLEHTSAEAHSQGLRWLLSVLVAVIAGIALGAKNDG